MFTRTVWWQWRVSFVKWPHKPHHSKEMGGASSLGCVEVLDRKGLVRTGGGELGCKCDRRMNVESDMIIIIL